jgi:RHS repeat-associated protein
MINYLYDINNNPIAIISNEDNKISVTSYSYEDKKVDSISTNGNTYFIDYDSKGKVKKINIGKQKLVEYSYDGDMIKQIKHGNGGSSEYEFDPNNNMTAMSENGEVKSTWEYNEDGKVIKQVDNENSVTYDYSYDENGEVVGITTNDGFTIEVNNHEDGYTLDYTINGVSLTHEVSIDPESGDSTLVMSNGVSVGINRSDEEISSTIRHKNKDIISQSFKIKDNHITSVSCNNNNLSYKYDVMGNIESLEENGSKMEQYEYDMKGQLIRVDSKYTNTSVLYEYDNGGNILNKTEYEYSNDVLKNIIKQDIFSYSDGNWKDKLTAYNGEEFTYDQYGNILSYRDGFTFNWDNGRMLTNATNIKYNINYKYNSNGLRTEKDVNGTKTTYYYDGSKIIKEDNNEYEIWYLYDTTGNIIGFDYDNNKYFYEKNIQNDIIGIYNESGDKIVSYVYDGWGKIVTMDGEMASTIGKINPFRYRSYYYDNETGLYYLQSRYYDPEICRFINADTLFDFGCGLQGYNLFQYCGNNPINRIDPTGQWVISLGIEFKAACIYGLFMSLQVNMDQNLNGSLTYTVGPVVMINASISFAGFICFYPSFTSVNQVLGWAFSAGVSWSMGLYGGASYGFNIASNNIYSNYCVSLGVGTSLAAIPTLYVQAGYTKLIKNFNVASLLSNLGTGQYNSYTNQGTKLYIKKSGSHYIDIYTNKFSKKVRIYDSKDIKVRD